VALSPSAAADKVRMVESDVEYTGGFWNVVGFPAASTIFVRVTRRLDPSAKLLLAM